jgi:glyoxylate/hydroxypyruvate/2-ketogluconate reductase
MIEPSTRLVRTMNRKIAVARRLPQPVLDQIARFGEVAVAPSEAGLDKSGLAELMKDADAALVTALDVVDAEVIAACPKLRLVCNVGVGYDNIDVAAASARGITVTNTPGAMDDAVADLVVGLMIGAARRLHQADAFVRSGQWTPANPSAFGLGLDVSRKTLGIVGFGRIGKVIARRALGFEMRTLYCDATRAEPGIETALNAARTDMDTLLAQSDYVVVQVPYTPATRHLIGAEQLAKMKKSAVLIHAGRGGVVDDAALAAALKEGTIAAAGLDCAEDEPHVNPALLDRPNVLFTPHIGSATPATRMNMVMMALRNLAVGLQGGTPPNTVAPVNASPP